MLAEERRRIILELLKRNGSVRTAELAQRFNVSDQTIRRDFWELEEKGLVNKEHGGALLVNYESVPYQERASTHQAEKLAIARAAAALVESGMTVALGPGTTTEALAQALDGRAITLITNSLTVASAVTSPATRVRLTGGEYRPGGELVVGDWSVRNLGEVFVDLSFIGVSGIGREAGYTVTEPDEALVLRQLIRVAKRSVIVTDASKFHRVAKETVAPLGAVHTVITDAGIPQGDLALLRSSGVEVVVLEQAVIAASGGRAPSGARKEERALER